MLIFYVELHGLPHFISDLRLCGSRLNFVFTWICDMYTCVCTRVMCLMITDLSDLVSCALEIVFIDIFVYTHVFMPDYEICFYFPSAFFTAMSSSDPVLVHS